MPRGSAGKPENVSFAERAAAEPSRLQGFWRTVKRAAGRIPFMEDVVAAYYCALDANTPLRAKAVIFGALGYFILPTDAIPDFILALGFTDDIAVLTTAIAAVQAHMRPAHRAAARQALADIRTT